MNIKSIKTKYNNIVFRSRLEATWAAFFDLLGWRWEYEPYELIKWIPDFALYAIDDSCIYVEVKPFTLLSEWQEEKKIKLNMDKEILLLGQGIIIDNNNAYLGFINDKYIGLDRCLIGKIEKEYNVPIEYDYYAENGSWEYRITKIYAGNGHIGYLEPEEILKLWREAKNKTQWKPDNG